MSKEYTVDAEIGAFSQSCYIVLSADGDTEEEAKSNAEKYLRDNLHICAVNAECNSEKKE